MSAVRRPAWTSRSIAFPSRILCILTLASLAAHALPAQAAAQANIEARPLSIADYALWRSISGSTISADGRWAAWTYQRERSDDTLHVRALDSGRAHVVALGSDPEFSDDGQWIAYFLSPSFAEEEALRRDDETVTRQAGLLNLASGATLTWEDAESFGFANGSSHFFVKKRAADRSADHDGTDVILRNLR